MPGSEILTRIRAGMIDAVLKEEETVLVACLRNDADHHDTLDRIKSAAVFSGPGLKVCYALDDLLPYFEKRYGITGTPSFLLFRKGRLVDTLLGRHSTQDLIAWIKSRGRPRGKPKGKPRVSHPGAGRVSLKHSS